MNKTANKTTGRTGEQLAVKQLEKKGYEILETNWGTKWGEIDIIARDGQTFVFVEVKTKVGENFGSPEEMCNWRKLAQVQRMAEGYWPAVNALRRIDMIAVVLGRNGQPTRIDHYEAVC